MIEFLTKYPEKLYKPLLEHIEIVSVTLIISFILAIIISSLILKSKLLSQITVSIFGVIYSIPSLALFALLIPLFGLGKFTAIIVLVMYNQFILIRNILSGFNSIDNSIIESAKGVGFTPFQIYYKISLPLASPIIIAGIKISVVTTISIAAIASTIGYGGLGSLLFEGLRTQKNVKIFWGTILISLLALLANALLSKMEKFAKEKTHT